MPIPSPFPPADLPSTRINTQRPHNNPVEPRYNPPVADRDAYLCDVVVILEPSPACDVDSIVAALKAFGLEVRDINLERCCLEGTIDAGKLRPMEELPGVQYVRCVYSYIADYPTGDPRDLTPHSA